MIENVPLFADAGQLDEASCSLLPPYFMKATMFSGNPSPREKGEVNLGAAKRKTVTANVRRIGYQPWFGKLELPDTASVQTVTLTHVALTLGEIVVTGRASISPYLQPFYDRWLMRQQGVLSATFIGPEEIEFRHPDKITNMLSGLNGVSFRRTAQNDLVAFGYNGTCQMAIVVDGTRQCPGSGCKCDAYAGNMPECR